MYLNWKILTGITLLVVFCSGAANTSSNSSPSTNSATANPPTTTLTSTSMDNTNGNGNTNTNDNPTPKDSTNGRRVRQSGVYVRSQRHGDGKTFNERVSPTLESFSGEIKVKPLEYKQEYTGINWNRYRKNWNSHSVGSVRRNGDTFRHERDFPTGENTHFTS